MHADECGARVVFLKHGILLPVYSQSRHYGLVGGLDSHVLLLLLFNCRCIHLETVCTRKVVRKVLLAAVVAQLLDRSYVRSIIIPLAI